jgi:biopolymer transport protein TolR
MRHGRRRPVNQINVVPYIDVMLVLLVIFMVTAPSSHRAKSSCLPSGRSSRRRRIRST